MHQVMPESVWELWAVAPQGEVPLPPLMHVHVMWWWSMPVPLLLASPDAVSCGQHQITTAMYRVQLQSSNIDIHFHIIIDLTFVYIHVFYADVILISVFGCSFELFFFFTFLFYSSVFPLVLTVRSFGVLTRNQRGRVMHLTAHCPLPVCCWPDVCDPSRLSEEVP